MALVKKAIRRTLKLAERFPWAIPLFGFASGVASFLLVERKQDQFAQIISILMLASWAWIALENTLQRSISQWTGIKIPPVLLRYLTQLVHQESLFFVVPFFFITTAWASGQLVFTSLLITFAIVSLVDPLYYHWLAAKRWLYFVFHGLTLFAALLTALPLLFQLPTPKSYVWSLGISVLLTTPGVMRSMSMSWWKRSIAALAFALLTFAFGIFVRPWIPPASLWLTQVAITDHIDESRSPTQEFKTITNTQLHAGIYAYTAIHAPRGLHERIYHQWIYKGKKMDKIALDISGGRDEGYHTWTHKNNFPAEAAGEWQIQVMTAADQIIGVLHFVVIDSESAIQQVPVKKNIRNRFEENNGSKSASKQNSAENNASSSPKTEAPEKIKNLEIIDKSQEKSDEILQNAPSSSESNTSSPTRE